MSRTGAEERLMHTRKRMQKKA